MGSQLLKGMEWTQLLAAGEAVRMEWSPLVLVGWSLP